MTTSSLISGALVLRTGTFTALRDRSDVFYRGFLVVFIVGIIAGAFASGVTLVSRALRPPNETQVTDAAIRSFEQQYAGPSETKPIVESYIRESVAMGFELSRLPPRAGATLRPLVRVLEWLGESLASPFGFGFMGLLLCGGLLVQFASHWLGGKATNAEMLGVSALAFAPTLLRPLSILLQLARDLAGMGPALNALDGLLGLVLLVWGFTIYVKATAIAQGFSYGRSLGAVVLAAVIGGVALLILAPILAMVFAGFIALMIAVLR